MPPNNAGPYHVAPDAPTKVPAVTVIESPTGKPLVPPAWTPAIIALWAALCAGVEALPEGAPKMWAGLALHVLGPVLGLSSAGLRRK